MKWTPWIAGAGLWLTATLPGAAVEALGPVPRAPTDQARAPRGLAAGGAEFEVVPVFAPVNTASRETSRMFYRLVYAASVAPPPLWTGDVASCDPGATEAAYRDLVALRINYFRAMAGLPAGIVFEDEYSAKAQAAALMISRNLQVNHQPPSDWACYTATGAEASGKCLLAVGNVGPGAIDAYIEDFGADNAEVGHRRWLLYPQTRRMGSGDIPMDLPYPPANATWAFDGEYGAARPATRDEYVAWPPPGFVPSPLVFPRWSFSYPQADFEGSMVTLVSNGVPVALELGPVIPGLGENTLVWHAAGQQTATASDPAPPPADTVYDVTIENVLVNGQARAFTYRVTVFDPEQPGPDTAVPELEGPVQPRAGVANAYAFSPVPAASSHVWLRGRREELAVVEGAEDGLGSWLASTSPGYDAVLAGIKASGNHCYHLVHPRPFTDQTLTSQRRLIPRPGAELRFKEYLGAATPTQTARVEVSVDDGQTWRALYLEPGSNGGGFIIFRSTAVPLDEFAGRVLRVRFNYRHEGGQYFAQTDDGVGWHLDDITFVNTDEIADLVTSRAAGAESFAFVPPAAGDYVLAVRGEFLDRYPLDWGPALDVLAIASPLIAFVGPPVLLGDQIQLEFQVSNAIGGLTYELLTAPSPAGPWTPQPAAIVVAPDVGTPLRVLAPTAGLDQQFFRVRGQ